MKVIDHELAVPQVGGEMERLLKTIKPIVDLLDRAESRAVDGPGSVEILSVDGDLVRAIRVEFERVLSEVLNAERVRLPPVPFYNGSISVLDNKDPCSGCGFIHPLSRLTVVDGVVTKVQCGGCVDSERGL